MKRSSVPSPNVSFNNDLFGNNKPFEASTTKSSLQMRARRSPDLGSSPISINSHIKNRDFYWFTTDWELTVTNTTFDTITSSTVQITANHIGGKLISSFRSIPSIGPGGTFEESFSPPAVGFSNMIMDSSNNPDLNFQVGVLAQLPSGRSANIFFNWGGSDFEFSGGQPTLTTTTRALSEWGTNGGVNVTVDIGDSL